jgi:hypothetical protein
MVVFGGMVARVGRSSDDMLVVNVASTVAVMVVVAVVVLVVLVMVC